jgi:predicted dithiol-disulfide oxidoreductase (DUF899 family)
MCSPKKDGRIRHTWGMELFYAPRDPGQDPRGVDLIWPLWNILDLTPGGRGEGWGVDEADAARMKFASAA